MKINTEQNVSRIKKRLVVFSGVAHHCTASGYLAHRGFVREIDIWARIFEQVLVVTRTGSVPIRSDDVAYGEKNISICCLPAPANTDGLLGKIKLLYYTPAWFWQSHQMLAANDIIMARGPDSIGFLGWLVSRFSRLPRFAKYADQWEGFAGEPLGSRLQKMFYQARTFGGPVMIYGELDECRPHLVPFFTSGISRAEWEDADHAIQQRTNPPPYRLLFVGRFVYFKGIDILLDAMKLLNDRRTDILLDLVGDGPERSAIQDRIKHHGLTNVNLHGWLGFDELSLRYAQAHVFIHPSRKEGFGKVLMEAMSYGLPIVGANVGVSPELVEKNNCGLLFQDENPTKLACQIDLLLSSDALRAELSSNGRRTSLNLVLESLEQRYRDFVFEYLD